MAAAVAAMLTKRSGEERSGGAAGRAAVGREGGLGEGPATKQRLIKRAKTVFIKFICGNMRRLK